MAHEKELNVELWIALGGPGAHARCEGTRSCAGFSVPGRSGQSTSLPAFYTLSNIVASPLTVSNFAFPSTTYPKVFNMADQTFSGRTVSGFDPHLRAPYTENYTIGIQRELWRNTVLE